MLLLIGIVGCLTSVSSEYLESVFEWNLVSYNTPLGYPGNDTFKPERTIITSVEVGWDNIYLAVPKIWSDNPATLVYIPRSQDLEYKKTTETSPKLEAYPSWEWHEDGVTGQPFTEKTCKGIINVFRVRTDRCNRLWALDCGILDSYTDPKPICPPKLLAFDMATNTLVKRIEIPENVLLSNSLLSNFAIDDTDENGMEPENNCDVGHIYISDIAAPAVLVYNTKSEEIWRHSNPFMYPHPEHAKFTVAGESFTLMDGIIGVALSNPGDLNRFFFFHPMSSNSIFALSTAALKEPPTAETDLPVIRLGDKSSQAIPLAFDPVANALVFSPATETALVSWTPGDKNYRVLAYDPDRLQWATEIRPAPRDENSLWVVTTRLQKYDLGTVNPEEVNQRVMRYVRRPKTSILGLYSPVAVGSAQATSVRNPLTNQVYEPQSSYETPLGLSRYAQ